MFSWLTNKWSKFWNVENYEFYNQCCEQKKSFWFLNLFLLQFQMLLNRNLSYLHFSWAIFKHRYRKAKQQVYCMIEEKFCSRKK